MSLNYQQLGPQVKELGKKAVIRERHLQTIREEARAVLVDRAADMENLQQKVDRAVSANQNLRCAFPLRENLISTHEPLGELPPTAILAVDGSQINPDRDTPVDYFLINIGGIFLTLDHPRAPEIFQESKLYAGQEMYTRGSRVTSGTVSLLRDITEREYLDRWARETRGKDLSERELIALTDGPLELWGAGDPDVGREFERYLDTLGALVQDHVHPAGYIDKPGTDLVVRLLEIARMDENDLSRAGRERPFQGVVDVELFQLLLEPGERSALFGIQSRTRSSTPPEIQLCFFYINVGWKDHPWLARVEVPAILTREPARIRLLQSAIFQQCQVLGTIRYPYVLHRAHEIALVSREENQVLTNMILQERWKHNLENQDISYKQYLKDQPGRTSYS